MGVFGHDTLMLLENFADDKRSHLERFKGNLEAQEKLHKQQMDGAILESFFQKERSLHIPKFDPLD